MSDTSKDLPFAEFKGDSDSEHRFVLQYVIQNILMLVLKNLNMALIIIHLHTFKTRNVEISHCGPL